jgi:C-terminal processing protease CtpA/Prc
VLAKNYSNISLPMGGAVLAINERQASEMFARFASWIPAENRSTNPWLIEHPVFLRCLLLLEFGPVQSWHLRIQTLDKTISNYTVAALALADFRAEEAATIERKKHYRLIPESNTAIVRFFKWREPEKFKIFLHQVFKDIRDKKVPNLIIDIRENTGGTDQCVHILMEYLAVKPYKKYDRVDMSICPQTRERIAPLRREFPDEFASAKNGKIISIELPLQTPADNPFRFTGRTFVLISPRSFSASTVFSSIVKCAKIATLIGEETRDPRTLYADSIKFELPHSGLQAWVPSKLLVCAGGKPDGRGVIPDYEVKQKPEDTAKGVDTVLQFTLNLIKNSKAKK